MANRKLRRYGLEAVAKVLIFIGFLFVLFSWAASVYYFGSVGRFTLFLVPLIFTCVLALLLLVIRYRYTLFEGYPYLMSLPSLFYHIKERKGSDNRSVAFSMIFTVHALVIAFLGIMSLVLVVSIGASIRGGTASPILYSYLLVIAVLIASVLLQYRRIYIRFVK